MPNPIKSRVSPDKVACLLSIAMRIATGAIGFMYYVEQQFAHFVFFFSNLMPDRVLFISEFRHVNKRFCLKVAIIVTSHDVCVCVCFTLS